MSANQAVIKVSSNTASGFDAYPLNRIFRLIIRISLKLQHIFWVVLIWNNAITIHSIKVVCKKTARIALYNLVEFNRNRTGYKRIRKRKKIMASSS